VITGISQCFDHVIHAQPPLGASIVPGVAAADMTWWRLVDTHFAAEECMRIHLVAVVFERAADAGDGTFEAVLTYLWRDWPRFGVALAGGLPTLLRLPVSLNNSMTTRTVSGRSSYPNVNRRMSWKVGGSPPSTRRARFGLAAGSFPVERHSAASERVLHSRQSRLPRMRGWRLVRWTFDCLAPCHRTTAIRCAF
jgi:hypothetical protein